MWLGAAVAALGFSLGSARPAGASCNPVPNGTPNGMKEAGEQCDDGNTNDNDQCDNACHYAACGDGILETAGNCSNDLARNCTVDGDCFTPGTCLKDGIQGGPANGGDGTTSDLETCDSPYAAGPPATGQIGCTADCVDNCGNNMRDFALGETCDRACAGGANAGQQCTADSDCPGSTCPAGDPDNCVNYSSCLGGDNNGDLCTGPADCPDGTCDGFNAEDTPCNDDCTTDTSVCDNCGDGVVSGSETCERPYANLQCAGGADAGDNCLVDGDCDSGDCANGTIGCDATCMDQCGNNMRDLALGETCDRACAGGANAGQQCTADSDCPGSTCAAGDPDNCVNYSSCLGGTNNGQLCTADADCGGGDCDPFEAEATPCNDDCTTDTSVCDNCGDGTTSGAETCDPPFSVLRCNGGADSGDQCGADSDCADGALCVAGERCTGGSLDGDACVTDADCCDTSDSNTANCGICGQADRECSSTCVLGECGNGMVEAGEECDNGGDPATCDSLGASDGDECFSIAGKAACDADAGTCERADTGATCTITTCNVQWTASQTGIDACRVDCRRPYCGDGTADPGLGEVCDDGLANPNLWQAIDDPDDCPDGANALDRGSACKVDPQCGDGIPHLFDTDCECSSSTVFGACTITAGCDCTPRCKGGGTTHGTACCDDSDCIEPADDPGVCINPCLEPCDNGNPGNNLLICLPGTASTLCTLQGGTLLSLGDCALPANLSCAGTLSDSCVVDNNCVGIPCAASTGQCGNSDTDQNACRTDCVLPDCGDDVKDNCYGEGCDNGQGACDGGSRDTCQGSGSNTPCDENSDCALYLAGTERCDTNNLRCKLSCGTDLECPAGQTCNMTTMTCDGSGAECSVTPCPTGQICTPYTGVCDSDDDCDDDPMCAPVTEMDCQGTCEHFVTGLDCNIPGNCNDSSGTGCSPNCSNPGCGDGIVQAGEECDGTPNCTTGCTLNRCGDGVPLEGEACDDGNNNDCDTCNSDCEGPSCGDGTLCAPESCDDGNSDPLDGCSEVCCVEPDDDLEVEEKCELIDCTVDSLDAALAAAPDTVESRYRKLFDKAKALQDAGCGSLPGDYKKACRKLRSARNRLESMERRVNIDAALGRIDTSKSVAIGVASNVLQGWYDEIRSQLGCRVVGH
jgi:cysteine-rich repeat protein